LKAQKVENRKNLFLFVKEKKNHVENHEKVERKWGKVWSQKKNGD